MIRFARLAVFLLLAPLARPEDDRPARRVVDPALQRKIHAAIDRGVVHPKRIQEDDGSWEYTHAGGHGGLTALALYALAASGVPAKDPAIRKGVRWTAERRHHYARGAPFATYSASLLVLALTRIDARAHRERIHRLAERIAGGQAADDLWTYKLRPGTARRRGPDGRPLARGRRGDNSNSQFAVLALWAAFAIADYEVPRATWERIRSLYERTQTHDGGWTYAPAPEGNREVVRLRPHAGRPSMIAAGLVSYVYGTAALLGGAERLGVARGDPVAVRGFRAMRGIARRDWRNYYFVYSLERVGTVMAWDEDEWYAEGARALVAAQRRDGAWVGRHRGDEAHVYATSLALLFLSRATAFTLTPGGDPRLRGPTTRRETLPDLSSSENVERGFAYYVSFDAARRRALATEFGKAGPAAIGLFVRKLRDGRLTVREAAAELLARLLEKKFLFEPAWPEAERELMLQPIDAFWRAHGPELIWDETKERFVTEP